ncbi:MAG: hypothetical protein FWH36_09160 [Lentimicrobiaceae bacterium]|nr:hypothetical protein [Lentimicrobiaceae bacterium]
MKKVLVIAVVMIVVGMAVSSCNTYKPCPAYGGHAEAECTSVADQT